MYSPLHPANPGDGFRVRRLAILAMLPLLHLACYWAATRAAALRDPAGLLHFATPVDQLIPHLAWTWPLYWLAYPFVLIGGGMALMRLPAPSFRRAVTALALMTLAGAAFQALLPARAPWPDAPGPMQQRFHASALVLPFATFPSMHVAYATVAAGLLGSVFRHRAIVIAGIATVGLVAISTLTLKEHVALDAVAGLGLAWLTLQWWHGGTR